jgi:hypothetical protein
LAVAAGVGMVALAPAGAATVQATGGILTTLNDLGFFVPAPSGATDLVEFSTGSPIGSASAATAISVGFSDLVFTSVALDWLGDGIGDLILPESTAIESGSSPQFTAIFAGLMADSVLGAGGGYQLHISHSGTTAYAGTIQAVVASLPAALPLFIGGLGVFGLMSWRRWRARIVDIVAAPLAAVPVSRGARAAVASVIVAAVVAWSPAPARAATAFVWGGALTTTNSLGFFVQGPTDPVDFVEFSTGNPIGDASAATAISVGIGSDIVFTSVALDWLGDGVGGLIAPNSIVSEASSSPEFTVTFGGLVADSDLLNSGGYRLHIQHSGSDSYAGTIQAIVAPLPAALPLFAAGFGLLFLIGLRKQRGNRQALAA